MHNISKSTTFASSLKILAVLVFISFSGFFKVSAQSWASYEEEVTIKVAGITAISQIPALTTTQKQVTRQYQDGLGRPIQTVVIKGSPTEKDIILPVTYDNLGRAIRSYLPYAGTDGSGDYRSGALTEQATFYSTGQGGKVAIDAAPYSESAFEISPLQRLLKQGLPGDGFQLNQHYKAASYRPNSSGETVRMWSAAGVSSGTYAVNALSAEQFTDEQGVSTLNYTDNSGRVILKRQLTSQTIEGIAETSLDTYYLYNDDGSLSYILPPKAVVLMRNASNWNISQTGVSALIFQFVYDTKGRLIQKTIPGGPAVYVVYDPLDRIVLIQDGNLRAANQWNYIKYDVKGRSVSQGIYKDNVNTTLSGMQGYVNGLSYTTNWHEKRSGTATNYGYYTDNCFPTVNNVSPQTALQALTYAYYDDYDLNLDGNPDYAYQSQGLTNEAAASSRTRGMMTIVANTTVGAGVSANTWLNTVTFYDSKGNAIQSQKNNHTNAAATLTDIATTVPDFTGKVLQDKKINNIYGSTKTILTTYQYDHADRLTAVDQSYNATTPIRIAGYNYNEVGQMIYKQLHSRNSGSTYMQGLDYRYNVRGQLLSINNSTLTAGSNNTMGTGAVWGMELLYDQVDAAPNSLNNTPYYNGLLSAVKWGTYGKERSYKYTYDDQNRIKDAVYADRGAGQGAWGNAGAYDEKNIKYDHNGNILALQRSAILSGSTQQADNLTYSYSGNRLNQVTDGSGANYTAVGFRNLTGSTSGTYAYDSNGNIVTDPYKGMTTEYNVLNRTNKVTITTSSGRYINYTYNSGGQLIKKQQYDGGSLQKTTDYVEGYLYENAALVSIGMPEGRMFNTGAELKPEYFITDQQGNVRLSFQEKLSLNITIVKQENSYYPYGLIMPNSTIATPSQPNRNLYNGGSEWQNDYGDLPDLYQTFYRSYDAALGRFTGIDPMAEKFNSLSPYHYAGNNPIMNNDPLGDDFTQQDWDNAMHALRYSRDGASIGEGGFIRYYTSAKDAQYTAAAAIDRSGGWGYTEYGSFRNFSDNMVYNYGRSFYGDWSNLRYGGNYGDVSGIPLKQVNIVKYKPLWLVEEEDSKVKDIALGWPTSPSSFNLKKIGDSYYTNISYEENYYDLRISQGKVKVMNVDIRSMNVMISSRQRNGQYLSKEEAKIDLAAIFNIIRGEIFEKFLNREITTNAKATQYLQTRLNSFLMGWFPYGNARLRTPWPWSGASKSNLIYLLP